MKRIFVLNGHPADTSLSRALADTYERAAVQAGHEVRIMHLSELHFDIDFGYAGYRQTKPLEPDLERVLADMQWCEHLLLVTPLWWGGLPAKLKGLIDRAFLPGRVMDTRNPGMFGLPRPLLTGRTARVIMTSDTPSFFLRMIYKNAVIWQLRRQILGLVGIKPSKFTQLSAASHASPATVQAWMRQVHALGRTGN